MSVLPLCGKKTFKTRQSIQQNGRPDVCSRGLAAGSEEATGGPTEIRDNTPDHAQASGFDALVHEIQELRENTVSFQQCFQNLKAVYQQKYAMIADALQEERYRCELLEEQIHDLTELHQNEISILKEELAGVEDKIAYLACESATDSRGVLEALQTRLFKLERQQNTAQLEGLENETAETLLGKVIGVLPALKEFLLAFASTVANYVISPLLKTCGHTLFTLLFVLHLPLQVEGVS